LDENSFVTYPDIPRRKCIELMLPSPQCDARLVLLQLLQCPSAGLDEIHAPHVVQSMQA
jgi:hypothetical protein